MNSWDNFDRDDLAAFRAWALERRAYLTAVLAALPPPGVVQSPAIASFVAASDTAGADIGGAHPDPLGAIQGELDSLWLNHPHVPDDVRTQMSIAAAEIGANIVEHTGGRQPVRIRMGSEVVGDQVHVEFTDDGPPVDIDRTSVAMPDEMAERGRVDTATTNVLTVEDPVEYELGGIGQTQVNPKIDLTFAKALRAILRQDPDVIMIGEIRDFETAQIAIQASLTGHLVLATLHTNDAPSAVTRLTDMGVEPFLLSSSLLGVLAQRLVRKLCVACKKTDAQGRYHPVGCVECGQTGYKGRTGVYELMCANDEVRALIHGRAAEPQLLEAAEHAGLRSMREDGERLVGEGITSAEEVMRVTRE